MYNTSFFKQILLVASIFFFVSCDKDYNEIGADLIGDNHFTFSKDATSTVEVSTKKTGAIASNNLEVNALGILDNDAFGKTTANFATQVQLAVVAPVIDLNLSPKVESVTLYIPYFTNKTVTNNTNGSHVYTLDSIYGKKDAKIKLNIYENKYLLGNYNTENGAPLLDSQYPQQYYTDQNSAFDNHKGQLLNDSSVLSQNNEFVFSPSEFSVVTPAVGTVAATTAYTAPGMRLDLNNQFFQNLIFNSNSANNLSNNINFENYFKGLYFNVEQVDAMGVLAMMNFKKGIITVKYNEWTSLEVKTLVEKSIVLNLTGNTVNLLNNDFGSSGTEYNSTPKSDRLYLRGGEGSVAIVDLFDSTKDVVKYSRTTKLIEAGSNGIPDELDNIKAKGWLINDASLTFYVDQTAMASVSKELEPNRIFLYDVKNKLEIIDYDYDGSTSTAPNYSKGAYGGIINKDATGKGLKYKISVTNYVRNLVNNDSTNVKLGVSVSQSILNPYFSKVKNAPAPYSIWKSLTALQKNAYYFPVSSVMSPLGTVLYGSAATVPDDKRLKLEIYYTKPN